MDRFFLPRVPVNHGDALRHFILKTEGRFDRLRRLQVLRDALLYDPQTFYREMEREV